MSDGIIEIGIKAPEFDRQLKRLGDSMNGTQLTLDEDIRLFEGAEEILLKLPLCKDGDMRAFRFPCRGGRSRSSSWTNTTVRMSMTRN